MTGNGILQILFYLVLLTLLTKPLGVYMTKVYQGERTFLSFLFRPVERLFYAICRVDPDCEMNWKQYGVAMLMFSMVSTLAVYAIQRVQFYLPWNPQALAAPAEHLSFNTAV